MSDSFKILVPIGFSEQSLNALNQALIFAKASENAHFTILSVIEDSRAFAKLFDSKNSDDLRQKVTEEVKNAFESSNIKGSLFLTPEEYYNNQYDDDGRRRI